MASIPAAWFLDVDGVIRAKYPTWTQPPVTVSIRGTSTTYAPELATRLQDLTAIIDIHWATSWCGDPDELHDLGAVLGLELPLSFGDRSPGIIWADLKVDAVRTALRAGRQVIWTDDAEVPAALRLFPELREAQRTGRLLAIAPDPYRGLELSHIAEIEAFGLNALRAPAVA